MPDRYYRLIVWENGSEEQYCEDFFTIQGAWYWVSLHRDVIAKYEIHEGMWEKVEEGRGEEV